MTYRPGQQVEVLVGINGGAEWFPCVVVETGDDMLQRYVVVRNGDLMRRVHPMSLRLVVNREAA